MRRLPSTNKSKVYLSFKSFFNNSNVCSLLNNGRLLVLIPVITTLCFDKLNPTPTKVV